MAFAYSAGIITQTGTDTDLSGLNGLTGVTTLANTYGNIYRFDNATKLVVDGILTIEPTIEELQFEYALASAGNPMKVNGTLTIGSVTNENGYLRYSKGIAINFLNYSSSDSAYHDTGWSNLQFYSGSVLNFYGGEIRSRSSTAWFSGSQINVFSQDAILNGMDATDAAGEQFPQVRMETTDVNIDAITTVHQIITFRALPNQFEGYNPIASPSVIDCSSGTPSGVFVPFLGLIAGQGNLKEVGLKATSWFKFRNTNVGSDITVASQVASQTGQNGLVMNMCDVFFKSATLNGTVIEGTKVYLKDTDNGSRIGASVIDSNVSYLDDVVYTGTTDVSGLVDFSGDTDAIFMSMYYRITSDGTDPMLYDCRFPNNDVSDEATWGAIDYNYLISSIPIVHKGTSGVNYTITRFVDTLITEQTKATTDAYTTIDNAFEAYDRAKSNLYDNYIGEEETTISRAGTQVILGTNDLLIDNTAVNPFDFDGSQVTIKTPTYTGGASATTGKVFIDSGSVAQNGAFDCDVYIKDATSLISSSTIDGDLHVDTRVTSTPVPVVIDGTDTITNGQNVSITNIDVTIPAYADGDLIIVNINAWGDTASSYAFTFPTGLNGESITEFVNDYGSKTTADDARITIGYFIANGASAGGTITFTAPDITRNANAVIKVPAGEFDPAKPLSTAVGFDTDGGNSSTPNYTGFTANSDDESGKLIAFVAIDQDPVIGTPTGWTALETADYGRSAMQLAGRDLSVTASESISASSGWSISSDAWSVYAYIIRPVPGSITDGQDTILNLNNVIVTGLVYNDDPTHTLTINATGGSSLTAEVPGTGVGQTDIQNAVSFSFTLEPSITGYEWRIYSVPTKGTLAGSTELVGEEVATVDNQQYLYNYTGDFNLAVQILPSPNDYEERVVYYTAGSAGQSVSISLDVDENN